MTPARRAFEEQINNALVRVAVEGKRRRPAPSSVMQSGADVVLVQNPGLTIGGLFKWCAFILGIFGAGYVLRGWGEASNGSANLVSYFRRPRTEPDPEALPPPANIWSPEMHGMRPGLPPLSSFQHPPMMTSQITTELPDGRVITTSNIEEASHALARIAKENS